MSKSLKSHSKVFTVLAAIALLSSLLYGRGQQASAIQQQEAQSTRIESQDQVKEVRGVVTAIDFEKKEMVIDLSGEDAARLGGKTEARIKIASETKIKVENNSEGNIYAVTEGAPVKIKLASEANAASGNYEVLANTVKLELACKASQGCPKSGECGRNCGSAACSCPLPAKSPSTSSKP